MSAMCPLSFGYPAKLLIYRAHAHSVAMSLKKTWRLISPVVLCIYVSFGVECRQEWHSRGRGFDSLRLHQQFIFLLIQELVEETATHIGNNRSPLIVYATKEPTFLVEQRHGYCFRINVPADLWNKIDLKEIRYSLKTKDYLNARATALPLGLKLRRFFSELRNRRDYLSQLSPKELKRRIKEFFLNELTRAEDDRLLRPDITPAQHQSITAEYGNLSYSCWKAFTGRKHDLTANLSQSQLKDAGIKVDSNSLKFNKLCRELLRANALLASVNRDRQDGYYGSEKEWDEDFYETYLAKASAPVQAVPVVPVDDSPRLSKIIKRFLNERTHARNWKKGYRKEMVACLRTFQEFVEEDIPTHQITSKMVVSFKDALTRLPSN